MRRHRGQQFRQRSTGTRGFEVAPGKHHAQHGFGFNRDGTRPGIGLIKRQFNAADTLAAQPCQFQRALNMGGRIGVGGQDTAPDIGAHGGNFRGRIAQRTGYAFQTG